MNLRTETYRCPKCVTEWVITLAFSMMALDRDKRCPRCNTLGNLLRKQELNNDKCI